jgi:hypothetical protein
MERMSFDDSGRLKGVDGKSMKTEQVEDIFSKEHWSLHSEEQHLKPLKFSNDKTQEDIVKEVVSLIKSGKRAIFLQYLPGFCHC